MSNYNQELYNSNYKPEQENESNEDSDDCKVVINIESDMDSEENNQAEVLSDRYLPKAEQEDYHIKAELNESDNENNVININLEGINENEDNNEANFSDKVREIQQNQPLSNQLNQEKYSTEEDKRNPFISSNQNNLEENVSGSQVIDSTCFTRYPSMVNIDPAFKLKQEAKFVNFLEDPETPKL